MDLRDSKWAPRAPPSFSYARAAQTPATRLNNPETGTPSLADFRLEELHKSDRLLRRLKWKSSLLYVSHQRLQQPQAFNFPSFLRDGSSWDPAAAEAMFKVDFFEFFVLLERVLVHLLGSLGISIARYGFGADAVNGSVHAIPSIANAGRADINAASANAPIFGTSGRFPLYNHRFHANVLAALEQPSNPVHTILGIGEVKRYLGIAKECRNRWKEAEEPVSLPSGSNVKGRTNYDGKDETRFHEMLADLDLGRMLHCIIEALNQASYIAEKVFQESQSNGNGHRVSGQGGLANGSSSRPSHVDGVKEFDMEDTPWEAMPDAMDWDDML